MHIDLIETLRCPRSHDESWLVARIDRMAGRHVAEGRLGCPVCGTEFPIVGGITRFDPAEAGAARGGNAPRTPEPQAGNEEDALRLAALLGMADGSGVVVLAGSCAGNAERISRIAPDFHLILLNPASSATGPRESREVVSVIVATGRLPIAAGAARGVALDENAGRELAEEATRVLRAGGRLVAPVSLPLPEGVAELVRDDAVWVAERRAPPRLVPLERGGR